MVPGIFLGYYCTMAWNFLRNVAQQTKGFQTHIFYYLYYPALALFWAEEIRYHLKVLGIDKNSHRTFMDNLRTSLNLVQDTSEDQSDVVIAFGTVTSRAETDVAGMLQHVPDTKPVVLVVFHHTLNPDCVVPDSRYVVDTRKVFTVDCLFHEDRGLLPCPHNNKAEEAVVKYLRDIKPCQSSQVLRNESISYRELLRRIFRIGTQLFIWVLKRMIGERRLLCMTARVSALFWSQKIRYHLKVLGKDKETHKTFIDHLSASLNLIQYASEDQSDVIIAFGTITSRAGTDIAEMLQHVPHIKPVVLVVFHHTFNPNCVVSDSRRMVTMSNVFTVDCLFHEDRGLLSCQCNNEAEKAVEKFLSNIKRR